VNPIEGRLVAGLGRLTDVRVVASDYIPDGTAPVPLPGGGVAVSRRDFETLVEAVKAGDATTVDPPPPAGD
jgi:hypothetical protein